MLNDRGSYWAKSKTFFNILREQMRKVQVWPTGAVLAYYFLLSLIPLLIVAGNILPYLNLDISTIMPYIEEAMPHYIFNQLESVIKSVFNESNTGVLSIASVGALWSASRGMNAMQYSMNLVYETERRKNVVFARLFSVVVTLFLILGLAILMLVFGFGQMILDYITQTFHLQRTISEVFQHYRSPVTMLALFFIFCLVYYVVPNVKLRFSDIFPGALFATLSWIFVSQAFAIYVTFFFKSPQSYGALGTIVLLLLWLQVSGVIITLGGILNASIASYQHRRKQEKEVVVSRNHSNKH